MSKTIEEIYLEMKCGRDKKEEKSLDPVNKDELKKKFDDRKDKDIDNDGDVDASDRYLHNRRKAIKKSMKEAAGAAIQSMTVKHRLAKDKIQDAMFQGNKPDHRSMPVALDDTKEKGHEDSTKVADKVKAKAGKRLQDKEQGDKLSKVTQKEETDLDEKLETDGPNKLKNFDRNFSAAVKAKAGGGKASEYLTKKAAERQGMNKKNDPGAAKKGLALSVLDRAKARKKAKERS